MGSPSYPLIVIGPKGNIRETVSQVLLRKVSHLHCENGITFLASVPVFEGPLDAAPFFHQFQQNLGVELSSPLRHQIEGRTAYVIRAKNVGLLADFIKLYEDAHVMISEADLINIVVPCDANHNPLAGYVRRGGAKYTMQADDALFLEKVLLTIE